MSSPAPSRPPRRRLADVRPLDRVRSLKVKLGLLVAASVVVAVVLTWAMARNGFGPRYTLPLALIGSLLITQVLARGMTSPLREMTAAARLMTTGDYSTRVRATSHDEVGLLADAFNQMATDLAEVDQQRRDLVANVSHELRTPVAALRAILENLVDGVSEPDPATLRLALAQTERLGDLVTELLDLSRVEAGVAPMKRLDVPVEVFLDNALDEATMISENVNRQVDWMLDVRPPDLTVAADQARLHQVVANLLDNAARHSPPGGVVRVRAWLDPDPDDVVIEVCDEGPGIAPQDRSRVFERFHRAGATTSTGGGTGLGLAIARWAVRLHGGTISVGDSEVGARMVVRLPHRAVG
ncbi:MAG: sensor histidine kinase [Actinomycetales bacterium]